MLAPSPEVQSKAQQVYDAWINIRGYPDDMFSLVELIAEAIEAATDEGYDAGVKAGLSDI